MLKKLVQVILFVRLVQLSYSLSGHYPSIYDELSNSVSRGPVEPQRFSIDGDQIDKIVEAVMKCQNIPSASVAVVQLDENDEEVGKYTKGYGQVVPGNDSSESVTNETRFCVGSITKQFTSAIVGEMLRRNNTDYDARLVELLKEDGSFFNLTNIVDLPTVRDLLAHRMAVLTYETVISMGVDKDRTLLWRDLHKLGQRDKFQLARDFRSSFVYNNWMYSLAGYISEVLAEHKSWEDLVREMYFDPLEMHNATFIHEAGEFRDFAMPAYRVENTSDPNNMTYLPVSKGFLRDNGYPIAPAGSICASATDMSKYLAFLLHINESSHKYENLTDLKRMIRHTMRDISNVDLTQMSHFKSDIDFTSNEYALGWGSGIYREYEHFSHGGELYGYLSYLIVFPELKLGIFVTTAGGLSDRDFASYIALSVFDSIVITGTQSKITPDYICTLRPSTLMPDPYKIHPFEYCPYTDYPSVKGLLGRYTHPVFGDFHVSYDANLTHQFRFKFGHIGEGSLCLKRHERDVYHLYFEDRLRPDALSPLWYYNEPMTNVRSQAFVRFHQDFSDRGVAIHFPFLEPDADDEHLLLKDLTYDPCSPNPCLNGGSCNPLGTRNFRCDCPTLVTGLTCEIGPVRDCLDLQQYYNAKDNGVYPIKLPNGTMIQVGCIMMTDKNIELNQGGWTVVQMREDDNVEFYRKMMDYENGFGVVGGSYWMGLIVMNMLTTVPNVSYTLRIDMNDCGAERAYETYEEFTVSNKDDGYKLNLKTNSAAGTAGDALTVNNMYLNANGQRFATSDNDNQYKCASTYTSGWWFNDCFAGNLNGVYYPDCKAGAHTNGISWIPWKPQSTSLAFTRMMIRRSA